MEQEERMVAPLTLAETVGTAEQGREAGMVKEYGEEDMIGPRQLEGRLRH